RDHDPDRPPAVHGDARRPHLRPRARPRDRVGPPRRAAGAERPLLRHVAPADRRTPPHRSAPAARHSPRSRGLAARPSTITKPMKILVLTDAEVEVLLPIEACIDVMGRARASLARGVVYQPLRMVVHPPGSPGLFALMPSYAAVPEPSFGLKVIGVFPGNVARGRDAHQGAVLLVSGETGSLLAMIN